MAVGLALVAARPEDRLEEHRNEGGGQAEEHQSGEREVDRRSLRSQLRTTSNTRISRKSIDAKKTEH